MNQQLSFDFMEQPVPDTLQVRFFSNDTIEIKARERVLELIELNRSADAQAMAKEWKV
mgnify:CR=1 FL=1